SSGLDKRQRHLALSAHRSADGLLSVINDILDISKIEADMLEIDLLDFDLLEVCEDAVEMVAESAQRKGLEIVSDFARDTPTLVGDPTRIRQVLVNLLSNAIKFTDEGEVRLGQRFVHREDDTLEVLFEVVDTGIGIAAEQLATIFDPFTQLDGSIKRSYSGTGLGLTISSRLVAIMNGELAVESEVGRGSCFRFNIALRISTHQAPPSVDNEILKGIRALVVGDRDVNHEILQGQLVSWGVRADSARDGMEAIALLEEAAVEGDPYRIGLFDWEMSEMDGIELAGRVKTDQRIPDLPIMILSSTFVAIDSQISQNIVNCFLTKPVRRQQLLNSLRGVLGGVNSPAPDSTVNTLKNRLGGRVLLAEDSRVNQEVAGAALEVAGCEVTIAENGVDALRAASEGFDLILMDCHMPEMDGFEATRRIRSLETESRLPRVPIIALTADVRKGIEEECESAGMDGYLSKPFSQKDLAAVLAEWLPVVSIEPTDSPAELQLENLRYFDVTAVQQLFDLSKKQGKNILRLVVQQYRDQFPGLLDVAREALENERRDQCADASHSLRSLAANVGATKIAELCAEVEREARAGSSSGLGGMFGDMEVAFAESQAELTILLSIGTGTETGTAAAVDETPQRILIADDDPSVVLAVGESLRGAGYEVTECNDGSDVLRIAKRNPPDVILLDAVMPGMDGFETCRRLNEDPGLCHVPVMMITGLNDVASINRAFAAGATAFSVKPINLALLLEEVRFVMRASIDAERVRDSQAQLEATQRLARIGYWQWKAQTDVFECSEQIETIFGYDVGKLGSDKSCFIGAVRVEDRDMVVDEFDKAAKSGEGGTLEYRVLTPAGHELLIRQETEVKYDAAGQCTVFGAVQDISMQRAVEDKIRKLAYYDPLTSLASRSYFMQRIEEATKAAKRREEGLAVFFMDLDGFKDVNDTLGHDVGDNLLEEVARRLRLVFRETDFIARLGGDEFVVLMENLVDSFDITQLAQRCLAEIEKPVDLNVRRIQPRMSIGIALFPQDGDTAQTLIKSADSAMYSAKQNGKHRFEYYSADLTEQAERRLSLVSDLRDAFDNDEFVLHYQPLIDLETGLAVSVEALVR
ncbi:MAG: response regulator, partial [Gammaproteobacteria bacterium]|nr:response regulator [Gammaproteobacteria bacterium]